MSPEENQQHELFLRSFTAHEPAVRAYVRRLLPGRADADDVMQDVSVVLWKKFGEFREGADFRPWAFGVARMEVLSWFRDKGRDRLVLAPEVIEMLADESVLEETHFDKQREALDMCMEKVEPEQRHLLMQAYQPKSRIHDVARGSGRSVTGFYQWMHRMRRMLLDCIQRETTGEGFS